ncbi:MAG: pyridoxine 5'-phosphate synthase [Verrucomicrobiota bacterium]|nr:pyridoxine 5'-phosphate synthase [Verrucomicrobiota bacterium]
MKAKRLRLGVNCDHVATLRQVRGAPYPDVTAAALACEAVGARGITVHLREDRRHIQDYDVYALRRNLKTNLNLEMANARDIVALALAVEPDEVCLVPEKREELTTEGGLDVAGQKAELAPTVKTFADAGIEVSLFIEPVARQIEAAAELGAPCIELHTGTFCNASGRQAALELNRLIAGAVRASELGLKVNAGHGINLANVNGILEIPYLDTLNIGHSIVAQAVFVGIGKAVKEMLAHMAAYRGGRHG